MFLYPSNDRYNLLNWWIWLLYDSVYMLGGKSAPPLACYKKTKPPTAPIENWQLHKILFLLPPPLSDSALGGRESCQTLKWQQTLDFWQQMRGKTRSAASVTESLNWTKIPLVRDIILFFVFLCWLSGYLTYKSWLSIPTIILVLFHGIPQLPLRSSNWTWDKSTAKSCGVYSYHGQGHKLPHLPPTSVSLTRISSWV